MIRGAQGVRAAKAVAEVAHHGQLDKAGAEYALHPRRVAAQLPRNDHEGRMTAWLHDVVEDSAFDCTDLLGLGFPTSVVDAVRLLTRTPDVSEAVYYLRIRSNPLALRVKLADIADNADPARLAKLPTEVQDRLRRKYDRARQALA